ncbi:hypothetical protein HK101_009954 [Irineochytrium annulatum]|nr:hypothetical protein HK101_009954 [Irineochytrium annulatum]
MIDRVQYFLRLKRAAPLLKVGHPVLRVSSRDVLKNDLETARIRNVIRDMNSIFSSPYHDAVGLAAPQVGHSLRIIAIRPTTAPAKFFINPTLDHLDPPTKHIADYESCESIPGYSALVRRSARCRLRAWDPDGKEVAEEHTGFTARILQHECDHLDGVTIVDRMEPKSLRHDSHLGKFDMRGSGVTGEAAKAS